MLFLVNGWVITFVETFISIRHVTGRTSHTSPVTTTFSSPDTDMASLTVRSLVGDRSMIGDSCLVVLIAFACFSFQVSIRLWWQWKLLKLRRELIRKLINHCYHIFLIGICTPCWRFAIFIFDIIVSILDFFGRLCSP